MIAIFKAGDHNEYQMSTLNLGLAIKFAPLIYRTAGISVTAVAVASCLGELFLFLNNRAEDHSNNNNNNKIKSSLSRSSVGVDLAGDTTTEFPVVDDDASSPSEIALDVNSN
ncbi:hypothetical protein BVC80_8799g11 [Macleaya cordata]|uniref:Uncharacterized protein n=1 Tax=Macleaya cordata TaxID=56857 RepID=A0A200PQ04_MACCD|nr:hypothetical protein BVC80_8799g11 [Macleaya cordata]